MNPVDNYPTLIQFGWKARRGKDTACAILQEEFGHLYSIRQYAYADAMRAEMLEAAYELWLADGQKAETFIWENIRKATEMLCHWAGVPFDKYAKVEPGYPGTKQRKLAQWWGTEYRRKQDPFYWVNKLRSRVEAERPQFALVSDMRFLNERAYGRSYRGYNIKLVRPDLDEQERLDAIEAGHISECELDSLPDSAFYRAITHTSVEDLRRQVIQLFNDILAEINPPSEFLEFLGEANA